MSELFHIIYIQPKWLICVVCIGVVLVWGIIARLTKRDEAYYKTFRVVAATLFVLIVVGILSFTLLGRDGMGERAVSLIPFNPSKLAYMGEEYYRTLIMNAALFVPFGMSMPFVLGKGKQADKEPARTGVFAWMRKRPVLATIITATIFSFVIEVVQLVFALGNCEIDDLLMNTLGAALGTLSYIICWKCVKGDVYD